MPAGSGRLQRSDRIRRSRDFQRVAREGRRVASEHFVILMAPRCDRLPGDHSRLGITVSRKVGGAVVRNRVKRRVRCWFRSKRCLVPTRMDLVVIARPSAARLTGGEVDAVLSRMLSADARGTS